MVHVLSLNILTTSQARKLWKRLKSYVERESYSVNVKFTNLANMPFPGGNLTLLVAWPNGQAVTIDCSIPPLKPKSKASLTLERNQTYGLIEVSYLNLFSFFKNFCLSFANTKASRLEHIRKAVHDATVILMLKPKRDRQASSN